jgi:hypothetical protein
MLVMYTIMHTEPFFITTFRNNFSVSYLVLYRDSCTRWLRVLHWLLMGLHGALQYRSDATFI